MQSRRCFTKGVGLTVLGWPALVSAGTMKARGTIVGKLTVVR